MIKMKSGKRKGIMAALLVSVIAISVVMVATMPTMAGESAIFEDDFESGNLNNWNIISGDWEIISEGDNHVAHLNRSSDLCRILVSKESIPDEAIIGAKVKGDADGGDVADTTIGFYSNSNGSSFYYVMLGGWSGGKYLTIGKRVGGVEYELVANTSVMTSNNVWYNVEIKLEESNIFAKIWVVGSSEPSDWQISYSGASKFGEYVVVGTEGGQDNEEFWFDNISVNPSTPTTVYVDDDYNYSTPGWEFDHFDNIQQGIDAVVENGTVCVYNGTYNENVDVTKTLTIKSTSGNFNDTIVQAANSNDHVFSITADYVNISGFTVTGATGTWKAGIYGEYIDYCNISNNYVSNTYVGIYLHWSSSNNLITNNVISNNGDRVIYLDIDCSNNEITNNIITNNTCTGIWFHHSSNNNVTDNIISNNGGGIHIRWDSTNNRITRNNINSNGKGISFGDGANNNIIYLNNFVNNSQSPVFDGYSPLTNIWNSTEKINYTYDGNNYTNYMGNYWDSYTDIDINNDGIWDTPYSMPESNSDDYPLMKPFENYFAPIENIFDTGKPANPYPSIIGNHTGTIKPNHTVIATELYTYPCVGTGGHTEYAEIRNATWNATATWKGYIGDWKNITFDKTVVLLANKTYNYTIRTGSYPQIHHTPALPTENGWINCTKFTDANGRIYTDWIPAIRLE